MQILTHPAFKAKVSNQGSHWPKNCLKLTFSGQNQGRPWSTPC